MPELEEVRMLFAYLRARLSKGRSERGMITMEVLGWIVVGVIVLPMIAAVIYYGWLNDAKDVQRSPRAPAAPTP